MKSKIMLMLVFLVFGIFLINLIVAPQISDETNANLFIEGGLVCSDNGFNWTDTTVSPIIKKPTLGEGNCYEVDGIPTTKCCPQGFECESQGMVGVYKCERSPTNFCYQLEQADCENNEYTSWIANNTLHPILSVQVPSNYCGKELSYSVAGNDVCVEQTHCDCEWEAGSCVAKSSVVETCSNNNFVPVPLPDACSWTVDSVDDDCGGSGFFTISYTGNLASCGDPVISYPCQDIVKLGFFNFLNVLSVIVVLFLVYYVYFILRANKSKKVSEKKKTKKGKKKK
ncbi:hypothetical protein HOD75_02070 [archaeon]|nr:hypothetical protein [archaeon]MBT4241663.1 hypothetical protein [archaeon]MBT4418058.1 hypothetical protein [archaeon]